MSSDANAKLTALPGPRPWYTFLAVYSFILAIITALPQFYYVLFALHWTPIGPNTNPLGEVWYWYILSGDNSYLHVDPGILAGAVEDAFLLGPLYFATGLGLARRRTWVYPVGLITGAIEIAARGLPASAGEGKRRSLLSLHHTTSIDVAGVLVVYFTHGHQALGNDSAAR